ncbi:hypothetical protein KEM54_000325 [Ascosphaera aggregata]|nr:hypothetical protein KEM54_000325 [Ascosphaera aggregata]
MPPKGLQNTRKAAMQLQTINKLRIRSPKQSEQNPYCWASTKKDHKACAGLEEQLRACTDKKV